VFVLCMFVLIDFCFDLLFCFVLGGCCTIYRVAVFISFSAVVVSLGN
jgi:hypothetical protein